MKIATIIIRVLIGLLLLFASIAFFLKLMPEPETTGDFKAFQIGLVASTYLMPLVKIIELICGLAYVSGRYVTLANLVILPVSLNILFVLLSTTFIIFYYSHIMYSKFFLFFIYFR